MAEQKPDKLEREIEEILSKIEQFPKPESRRAMARRRALRRFGNAIAARQRAVVQQLSRVAVSQIMLLSFIMIVGSFFFRRVNPLAMQWVLYAGIVLFVSSFAIMIFTRSPTRGPEQRWRGRTLDHGAPSLLDRIRRWYGERGGRARR